MLLIYVVVRKTLIFGAPLKKTSSILMINIERKGEKSADHLYEVHLTLPKVSKLFSEMKASPFFLFVQVKTRR